MQITINKRLAKVRPKPWIDKEVTTTVKSVATAAFSKALQMLAWNMVVFAFSRVDYQGHSYVCSLLIQTLALQVKNPDL